MTLVAQLPIAKLVAYWLSCGEESISLDEIASAIYEKRFQPTPVHWGEWTPELRQKHIERIAYLAVFGWNDPIEVDVGIPVLNYYSDHLVVDGNHRLAAAIFLGRKTIAATIAGQVSYAEELFEIELE